MRKLMELALEATSKAERFLEALERNPSRMVLVNAFVVFEELLKTELARCCGYSKKTLNLNFTGLLALAKKEFREAGSLEHWRILDNLSRLRDCAAKLTTTNMPFADIIPRALRDWFPEDILKRPCLEYLQPRLADTWKFLTQFTYLEAFYHIRMAGAPTMREELAQEFKRLLENVREYLNGPDGAEMLAHLESGEEPQQA